MMALLDQSADRQDPSGIVDAGDADAAAGIVGVNDLASADVHRVVVSVVNDVTRLRLREADAAADVLGADSWYAVVAEVMI